MLKIRILAGILSIPVDFDVLRFRITEITSVVQISVNVNVDFKWRSMIIHQGLLWRIIFNFRSKLIPILAKKSLKDSAIDLSSEATTSSTISSLMLV
jgi:hypothetical protein